MAISASMLQRTIFKRVHLLFAIAAPNYCSYFTMALETISLSSNANSGLVANMNTCNYMQFIKLYYIAFTCMCVKTINETILPLHICVCMFMCTFCIYLNLQLVR